MPPKATEFQTSYESQTDDQVIDAAVDDSLRSYMDSGEQIFEQEEVDGQVLQRGAVVDQVSESDFALYELFRLRQNIILQA